MKELSIEEKAKRYDEALEKSKILYEQGTITESLCYVFPELKESEDEKIRKDLINFFEQAEERGVVRMSIHKVEGYLHWLEKQGEQNNAWSEEDEKMLNQIISIIENADDDLIRTENVSIYTNWLKARYNHN